MTNPYVPVILEADGACLGNPGPGGYGALVRDPDTNKVLAYAYGPTGHTTNNVAEYRGLIAGLRIAAKVAATTVEARLDSKLVVEQMAHRWRVKHPGLKPLWNEAQMLLDQFNKVDFKWVSRVKNEAADRLATAGLRGQRIEMIYPTNKSPQAQ